MMNQPPTHLDEADGEDGGPRADGAEEVEVEFEDAHAVRQVVDALLRDAVILCFVGCGVWCVVCVCFGKGGGGLYRGVVYWERNGGGKRWVCLCACGTVPRMTHGPALCDMHLYMHIYPHISKRAHALVRQVFELLHEGGLVLHEERVGVFEGLLPERPVGGWFCWLGVCVVLFDGWVRE